MGFLKSIKQQYMMYAGADGQKKAGEPSGDEEKAETGKKCGMDMEFNCCPFLGEDKIHCAAMHNSCHYMKFDKEKNSFMTNYYRRLME